MRGTVAKHAITHWGEIFPWDAGEEYFDLLHTTMTDGAGGDGRHLAVASSRYRVRITVAGNYPYTFGDEWPGWTVRFDARQELYDVVAEEEEGYAEGEEEEE